MNEQCSAHVSSGARWDFRGHQCTRKAIVERNGKSYCKIHDPVEVEKRDLAARKKFRKVQWNNKRKEKIRAFTTVCKYMKDNDIKVLTFLMIGRIIENIESEMED